MYLKKIKVLFYFMSRIKKKSKFDNFHKNNIFLRTRYRHCYGNVNIDSDGEP